MKTRVNIFSILLAACMLLAGSNPVNSDFRTGTITGTVSDASTGLALAGVNIRVAGTTVSTQSGTDGGFTLTNVPIGKQIVLASFPGYVTESVEKVDVCDGCTVELDINLNPGVDLNEEVKIEYERPLVEQDALRVRESSTLYAPANMPGVSKMSGDRRQFHQPFNTEEYAFIDEAGFLTPRMNPLSTFSIDVDAASYSNMRRFLNDGVRPPIDAIRTEELVNYFVYDYPHPDGSHPVEIYTELGRAPWNPDNLLLHIGLQAEEIAEEDLKPSNLVFLLDVSGSMDSPDKLGLLKKSFALLVNELTENDRVAIVVYAGAAGLVLPSTPGNEKETILRSIDRLSAGGSTAGGAGIQLAYKVASKHMVPGGNNRVILATDGDFNVGVSATGDLVRIVTDRKKEGIGLTVLGLGTGNLKDARMESIADKGDGNYYYIDSILEGKKVFVNELRSTLYTVAKDVKIQVEFNPAVVGSYRLIGYENRALNAEDFVDDKKDAGEMGSGHTVTALYEITLADGAADPEAGDLRYQRYQTDRRLASELGLVKLRYKTPHGEHSTELNQVVSNRVAANTSDNFDFAASVAMFSMILRDSPFSGTATTQSVMKLASASKGTDAFGYRSEFLRLVERLELMDLADAGPVRRNSGGF